MYCLVMSMCFLLTWTVKIDLCLKTFSQSGSVQRRFWLTCLLNLCLLRAFLVSHLKLHWEQDSVCLIAYDSSLRSIESFVDPISTFSLSLLLYFFFVLTLISSLIVFGMVDWPLSMVWFKTCCGDISSDGWFKKRFDFAIKLAYFHKSIRSGQRGSSWLSKRRFLTPSLKICQNISSMDSIF